MSLHQNRGASQRISRAVIETLERRTLLAYVTGSHYDYATSPQQIEVDFSHPVTILDEALYLTNLTTANQIDYDDIDLSLTSIDVALATFPDIYNGYFTGALPSGNYEAIFRAARAIDQQGSPLVADYHRAFTHLLADANGDGSVDSADEDAWSLGYAVGATTVDNGDFNYDGVVDYSDYSILNAMYGMVLHLPPAAPNMLTATSAIGPGRQDVNWVAPSNLSGILGYGMFVSADGVEYTLHATVSGASTTTWHETGLPEGYKRYYRVRAFNNEGFSTATNEVWTVTNLPGPVTATISDITTTSMKLNWNDNAADEDGYEVWLTTAGATPALLNVLPAGSGAMSYTATGLDPNTQYTLSVNAFTDAAGSLPASATGSTLDGPVEPAAPFASLVGASSLSLHWTDNSWDETGFEIERSTDGINFTAAGTAAADTQSHALSSLSPDTLYTLRVRATGNEPSQWATLSARTLPSGVPIAPSHVEAFTSAGAGSSRWWEAVLNWQDNSSDETGFTIQQLQPNGTWTTVATVDEDITTYTFNDLDSATDYTWRVLGEGPGGSSGGSGGGGSGGSTPANQASATTPIAYGGVFDSEDEQWSLSDNGGIQRQWGGAAETAPNGDLIVGTGDGAVTLTLSNLPKHGALVVNGDIGGSLSRITVDGTDTGHTPDSGNGPWWVPHTGGTVTIVLDPGPTPGMAYSTPWVTVQMDTPSISVSPVTVGVGEETQAVVHARDHGFMPMPSGTYSLPWPDALTLMPKVTPEGIVSTEGAVPILANAGQATFDVRHESPGTAQLVLAAAQIVAKSAPANVIADRAKLVIDGDRTLYVGQSTLYSSLAPVVMTLTNAELQTPIRNKQIKVTSSDPARVALTTASVTTNENGQGFVDLRALKRTLPNKPVVLTANYLGQYRDRKSITVLPVELSVDRNQVTVAKNATTSVTVTARAGGQPVPDVSLVSTLVPDLIFVSNGLTGADGAAIISIGGGLFGGTPGEATLTIRVQGDPAEDAKIGVLVTVTQ